MTSHSSDDDTDLSLELPPEAFFQEVVTLAIEDRRLETSRASEAYLVSLLTEHARRPQLQEVGEPFGMRLAQAMQTSGGERFNRLRTLGDDVLFVSGFFADHLERRGVPLDYATGLGQVAYGRAASLLRVHVRQEPLVFEELSDRFPTFVALLQHVADMLAARSLKDSTDVLSLYERWSRTGSSALAQALGRMGLTPGKNNAGLN
jgi:hypothetical protein